MTRCNIYEVCTRLDPISKAKLRIDCDYYGIPNLTRYPTLIKTIPHDDNKFFDNIAKIKNGQLVDWQGRIITLIDADYLIDNCSLFSMKCILCKNGSDWIGGAELEYKNNNSSYQQHGFMLQAIESVTYNLTTQRFFFETPGAFQSIRSHLSIFNNVLQRNAHKLTSLCKIEPELLEDVNQYVLLQENNSSSV